MLCDKKNNREKWVELSKNREERKGGGEQKKRKLSEEGEFIEKGA